MTRDAASEAVLGTVTAKYTYGKPVKGSVVLELHEEQGSYMPYAYDGGSGGVTTRLVSRTSLKLNGSASFSLPIGGKAVTTTTTTKAPSDDMDVIPMRFFGGGWIIEFGKTLIVKVDLLPRTGTARPAFFLVFMAWFPVCAQVPPSPFTHKLSLTHDTHTHTYHHTPPHQASVYEEATAQLENTTATIATAVYPVNFKWEPVRPSFKPGLPFRSVPSMYFYLCVCV